jgi:hypothetical protein
MPQEHLEPIKKLYTLWEPVYPYLAREIGEIFGRLDGMVVEVGPFCGAIFAMVEQGIGRQYGVATFPQGLGNFYSSEAQRLGVRERVEVYETTPALPVIPDSSVDCLLFRGALFFPGLFTVDFQAIRRVLRSGGIAFVGGGFGRQTPHEVIAAIGRRSRDLNTEAGKVEVSIDTLREACLAGSIPGLVEIITDGGLWVIMRKD